MAIGGEIGLEHVLELIVKRGRALIGARSLVIMLREGDALAVHSSAGHAESVQGVRLPISGSTSGQVLERGQPERITDVSSRLRIAPREFGVPDAQTAMLVPMLYRGAGLGILAAFDHGENRAAFSEEDEQILKTFAASAATAVALAQSVQSDRLRASLAAADAERRRWATGASRRDTAGPRRSPPAALVGGSQRGPRRARGRRCARRSATSSRRSRTSGRSSPSCGRPHWTSSAWRPRSMRCSTATVNRAG